MKHIRSTGVFTLAAASAAMVGTLALPAAASAEPLGGGTGISQWGPQWGQPGHPGEPGPGRPPGAPAEWHHPEWGAGWNDGYPQQGWQPPQGWEPPPGWTNPTGWQPPAGAGWCGGPIRDLIHPICWFLPH